MTKTLPARTPAAILRELGRLSVGEMDAILSKLHMLRATKKGALQEDEAALLDEINASLPPEQRTVYRRLCTKRRNGSLSPAEHRELIRLSDSVEVLNAGRAQSLVKLAALRQTPVPKLMATLGLESLVRA